MAAKSRQFPDEMDESVDDIDMSDADLEALMGGASAPSAGETIDVDKLEPGERIEGTVIDTRGGDVLVDLDGKNHGLIEEEEFEEDEDLPMPGTRIKASVVRYDGARDLLILSVGKARKEVFWDDLRPGTLLEARVTGTNKGGLDLDIKGVRAFMPLSQIDTWRRETGRREDLQVGAEVEVEIQRVDTERERISLDIKRGTITDWSASAANYEVGEEFTGWVSATSEKGLHVSIEEGVEGIIPRERVLEMKDPPAKGDIIRTCITSIDPEKKVIELKPL